jgi:hypothetical protein
LIELAAAGDFIRIQCELATGLQFYENDAPAEDVEFGSYVMNRGGAPIFQNGNIAWIRSVWNVVAVTPGNDTERPDELAEAIHEALHGRYEESTTRGCVVRACEFEQPLRYPSEGQDGAVFRHHGAFYTLLVQRGFD